MNKALAFLEQQVGKPANQSPSRVMRWFNPTLQSVAEGKVVFSYTIREEMTNVMRNLHGGMAAAIIDDCVGAALFSYGEMGTFYASINLSVDYLGPARQDDTIIAEGRIIKKGRTLVYAEGEIWNAKRTRLLVRGTTSLIKTGSEQAPGG